MAFSLLSTVLPKGVACLESWQVAENLSCSCLHLLGIKSGITMRLIYRICVALHGWKLFGASGLYKLQAHSYRYHETTL